MIKMKIICEPDQLEAHMRALGFSQMKPPIMMPGKITHFATPPGAFYPITDLPEGPEKEALQAQSAAMKQPMTAVEVQERRDAVEQTATISSGRAAEPVSEYDTDDVEQASIDANVAATTHPVTVAASAREPGKPATGRQRRTKAEIAEDDARERAIADAYIAAPAASASTPNISTGEPRVDPQDAEDEAAETAATKSDKLTRDDVRAAHKRYSDAFGFAAGAQVRGIIGMPIAELPETEEALSEAIAKIDAAIAKGRQPDVVGEFVRETREAAGVDAADLLGAEPVNVVNEAEPEPMPCDKATLILAVGAYGWTFDGEKTDANKMPIARQDIPRILERTFGAGCSSISLIPQTEQAFGKARAAIAAELKNNTFGRVSVR